MVVYMEPLGKGRSRLVTSSAASAGPAALLFAALLMGARIKGALGDIDPLNKVPFERATK